jgi:hypothetical protein
MTLVVSCRKPAHPGGSEVSDMRRGLGPTARRTPEQPGPAAVATRRAAREIGPGPRPPGVEGLAEIDGEAPHGAGSRPGRRGTSPKLTARRRVAPNRGRRTGGWPMGPAAGRRAATGTVPPGPTRPSPAQPVAVRRPRPGAGPDRLDGTGFLSVLSTTAALAGRSGRPSGRPAPGPGRDRPPTAARPAKTCHEVP